MSDTKRTKRQLIAEITALKKQITSDRDQIRFLQGSVHERNLRTERAERSEKAAKASADAICKLYVDGK